VVTYRPSSSNLDSFAAVLQPLDLPPEAMPGYSADDDETAEPALEVGLPGPHPTPTATLTPTTTLNSTLTLTSNPNLHPNPDPNPDTLPLTSPLTPTPPQVGLRLVGRGEGRDLRTYPSALLGSDATKGEEVTLTPTLTLTLTLTPTLPLTLTLTLPLTLTLTLPLPLVKPSPNTLPQP